jgi:type IV secretory pathway ATPase VirB11/archaellum biosynthesis ATPase
MLIMNEAFGVGALQPLIEDDAVKEIYLNGAHQLVYLQQSRNAVNVVNSPFTSIEQAKRAAMRILNGLGREGQTCAEGRLGPFRTFVDLEGAEGPHICLQRVRQAHSLSGLVSTGQVDQQLAQSISNVMERGGKLVIAGPSSVAQSSLTSAIAQELLQSKRALLVGVNQHLGSDPSWLTVEGSDDALNGAARLNPDAVIISDQPSLSGDKMLETLSSASAGILMLTARDVNSAVAKLRRRAGDDMLAVEAADAVIFVHVRGDELQVTDVYHVAQGQLVFSQGTWSGHLA